MRIGHNPLKKSSLPPPARIVAAVITHLPDTTSDYHKTRLDVIQHSITSLIKNAGQMDYSLIVWDNGSVNALTAQLISMCPNKLILSENIGKVNALKSIMRILPPETILAYGDDDIEYFPGWLKSQVEILETYPNVGTVTGFPVRLASKWGEESTLKWAQENALIEEGRFISDAWERDYCESVGRAYSEYATHTASLQDKRITYRGVSAYASSQHCQFVCYPDKIEPLINWTSRALEDEIRFDKAIDAAGMLRLSTVGRYTRHIGNIL